MLQPIADRVLIKPDPMEEKTASGLYIPEQAKERPIIGTVIAIGQGKPTETGTIPMFCKEGDRVYYHKNMGQDLEIDSELYILLHEYDIFGIL